MSHLPKSFDPFIIKDELLQTLKNSPLTTQLVAMRGEEIIEAISQKPIIINMQSEIQKLRKRVSELQSSSKNIKEGNRKQKKQIDKLLNENEITIQLQKESIEKLQNEVEDLTRQVQELRSAVISNEENLQETNKAKQQIEQQNMQLKASNKICEENNKNLSQEQQKTISRLKISMQEANEKLNQKEAIIQRLQSKYESELKEQLQKINRLKDVHKNEIENKNNLIEKLKEQIFNSKNEVNSLKYDNQNLIIEINDLKDSLIKIEKEYIQINDLSKIQKINYQKQRKLMNNRFLELNQKYKVFQKLKNKLKKLQIEIVQLRKQNVALRINLFQIISKKQKDVEKIFQASLDQIGQKMGKQIQLLFKHLNHQKQQLKLSKLQNKNKQEQIDKLQKIINSDNKEANELKTQLRIKRMEEQKLKKQLKKNYEETDVKLDLMEKKYRQLLKDSTQLFY